MKTEGFNLSNNIINRLAKNGITIATPIQQQIIPAILSGRDILAQSETGSGKTLSFAIPIIETSQNKKAIQALILVPTRELCKQITDEFFKFSERGFITSSVYGGVSIENQIRKIKKSSVIIATPGRLLDIMQRKGISFKELKYLVLDEADRMLDMGFIMDIEKILKEVPKERQTMLFSATISREISNLSKKFLKDPVKVSFESTVKPEFLNQTYYKVVAKEKILLLAHLLKKESDLVLVFCNRKHTTEQLANELTKQGLNAKCLNGDMTQDKRERVTKQFKEKKFNILIATDVASRGLHIEDISHVYNYEIPREVESYTHRIGRTARAGKKGNAISFVSRGEDEKFFRQILFEYKGNITLKLAEKLGFSKVDIKPERETSGSGRKKEGSYGKKREFGGNRFRKEGDKKREGSYGKKKEYGDKKTGDSYGKKREYGDKKTEGSYGKKREFGDNKFRKDDGRKKEGSYGKKREFSGNKFRKGETKVKGDFRQDYGSSQEKKRTDYVSDISEKVYNPNRDYDAENSYARNKGKGGFGGDKRKSYGSDNKRSGGKVYGKEKKFGSNDRYNADPSKRKSVYDSNYFENDRKRNSRIKNPEAAKQSAPVNKETEKSFWKRFLEEKNLPFKKKKK